MKFHFFPQSDGDVPTMRRAFFIWLAACTTAAFIASLIVSFSFETLSAGREARRTIESKILEARAQALRARENLATVSEYENRASICRARAVAQILENAPTPLDETRLKTLAESLFLDEIDVVDGSGICVASWPSDYVGFDYSQQQSTRDFLKILDDPTLEIAQPTRQNQDGDGLFQYSAVSRRDAPGLIEVGIHSSRLEEARELADLARFIGSFNVGKSGFLLVYQNGKRLETDRTPRVALKFSEIPIGQSFDFRADGKAHYAFAVEDGATLFVGALPQAEIFAARRAALVLLIAANFLLFLVVFAAISTLVQRLVVRGVRSIVGSLQKIASGDLDERVEERGTQEFAELSSGINATVDALKGALSEVKRRIAEELELARRIQEESLPKNFSIATSRRTFDIYAENRPESSVGGDMYDFFFVDGDRFLFYVADVSGHGVPAALFMMKTMALIENLALSDLDLAQIVTRANRYLSENNDSTFVTGFFCLIETSTGRLTYVDAGHNPPAIRSKLGVFSELDPKINLLLGVDPTVEYESATLTLEPGASIFLFTDGVTEALSSKTSELFGTERLLAALDALSPTESAQTVVETIFATVEQFAAGADRSDDVTALYFRYDGPAPTLDR